MNVMEVNKMGVYAYVIEEVREDSSFKQSGCSLWFDILVETHNDIYTYSDMAGVMILDELCLLNIMKAYERLKDTATTEDCYIVERIIETIKVDIENSVGGFVRYYCY